MIRSIFFVSKAGEVLIERHFMEQVPRNEFEPICSIIKQNDRVTPIADAFGVVYVISQVQDLFIVAACSSPKAQNFASDYLIYLGKAILSSFKQKLSLDKIKTDFSIIYQLIDQSIDTGFPFLDEENALIASISPQPNLRILIDTRYPWRGNYTPKGSSEFFVDVVETVETRVNTSAAVQLLYIKGSINIHSKLPGQPLCRLSISIPQKIVDFSYHRCIDPTLYLSRNFQFVPPDGDFTMMTYTTHSDFATLPLTLAPRFTWSPMSVVFDIEVRVDPKLPKPLSDITVIFCLPKGIYEPSLASPSGKTEFDPKSKKVKWSIKESGLKQLLLLSGSASIDSNFNICSAAIPIYVQFKASGYAVSGMRVDSLDIDSSIMSISKAVRYSTVNGEYIFDGI